MGELGQDKCGLSRVVSQDRSGKHSYFKVGGGRRDPKELEKEQKWGQKQECREWEGSRRKPVWITFENLACKVWREKQ